MSDWAVIPALAAALLILSITVAGLVVALCLQGRSHRECRHALSRATRERDEARGFPRPPRSE